MQGLAGDRSAAKRLVSPTNDYRVSLAGSLPPQSTNRTSPMTLLKRVDRLRRIFNSFSPSLLIALVTLCSFTSAPAATPVVRQLRASELDPASRSYPEINFRLVDEKGKPADVQYASVDPAVPARGELVIWLMGYNAELFRELNAMGLHVIGPHYARGWFSICCQQNPVADDCRGNLRLEAATGLDVSDEVAIDPTDSLVHRATRMVEHLASERAAGNWGQFLASDGTLDWSKVILSGASHGATTAARLAKHQRVARVVCLCGPRDQYQSWQALPSATPPERFFGFSHVLDGGWTDDHYCRSWQMMGLARFGPIVNVDDADPPYGNTRRLISSLPVKDDKAAHSSVTPGSRSPKTAAGDYAFSPVWRYLYTHPVEQVGEPVPTDPDCRVKPQR